MALGPPLKFVLKNGSVVMDFGTWSFVAAEFVALAGF